MKLLMTLMAMLIFTSYAVAQELDPCADESGAGYGLCNAYCVAMNCDDPDLQEASFQACEKVAANYEKIVGRVLTCGECPCFTEEDINTVLGTGFVECNPSQSGYSTIYGSPPTEYLLQGEGPDYDGTSDSCYRRIGSTSGSWMNDIPENDSLACYYILLSKMNETNCDQIW